MCSIHMAFQTHLSNPLPLYLFSSILIPLLHTSTSFPFTSTILHATPHLSIITIPFKKYINPNFP